MVTVNQLLKKKRWQNPCKTKKSVIDNSPQNAGICIRVFTRAPKKPNSASRKVAFIRFRKGFKVFAYIPGEGHSLQEHSVVLVRGGRVKDLPGVKYHLIRGVFGLDAVKNRKQGRSKYGAKKPNKI